MAITFVKSLIYFTLNANVTGNPQYVFRQQLQELHSDVSLLSETHPDPHQRLFLPKTD
jgi:hypothetical protein